jgi:hypothetical protein
MVISHECRRAKRHFCSLHCRTSWARVVRTCKWCGKEFCTSRSRVAEFTKSNSRANYCNRSCYHQSLRKPDRETGRGSGWPKCRTEALRRAPFCGRCGRLRRLDVHHIVPFRLTRDNRQVNLIPLCIPCHRVVEAAVKAVLATDLRPEVVLLAFGSMLRQRQRATIAVLRRLTQVAERF